MPRKVVNRLDAGLRFTLWELVRSDFEAQGLTDKEFAVYAQSKLGFPVAHDSVRDARVHFGIAPTNRPAGGKNQDLEELASHVTAFEVSVQNNFQEMADTLRNANDAYRDLAAKVVRLERDHAALASSLPLLHSRVETLEARFNAHTHGGMGQPSGIPR